jgi:hypothetical protein
MEDIDFARLAKVALTGAVTAIIADYAYTNYGEEFKGLLSEILDLIARNPDVASNAARAAGSGRGAA